MVAIAATALFAYLILVAPARGKRNYVRFTRRVEVDRTARYRFYVRAIRRKFMITLLVVALYLLDGRHPIGMPIGIPKRSMLVLAWIVFCLGVGTMLLRRRLASGARLAKFARAARGWIALLPTTRRERRGYIVFAIGAGVTEEILYRGFVFAYLSRVFPDASRSSVVVATAAVFGAAHFYQGMKGVFVTGLLGAWLGWLALTAGLVGAIGVHAIVDLRLLALPDLNRSPARTGGYAENGTTS